MVNVIAFESPVPWFAAVTCAVPDEAMSADVMAAVIWLPEMKLVERAEPFHLTVAPLTKLLPLTVNVNAGPPAVAELGLKVVSVGGLAELLTVNETALESFPSGFVTLT